MTVSEAAPASIGVKAGSTVLWIDDSESTLMLRKTLLESSGYKVLTSVSGLRGLELLKSSSVDAVIVDYEMPEMDGASIAAEIKRRNAHLPVLMVSGCVSPPELVLRNVNRFIGKGQGPHVLLECLKSLIPETAPFRRGRVQGLT